MHRWATSLILAAALLCAPTVAHGMAPTAGETTPGGSLRPQGETQIIVVHEDLLLDLTETEGRIRATYQLQNPTDRFVDLSVAFSVPPWVMGEWKVGVQLDGRAYPVGLGPGPVALSPGETDLDPRWVDPFTGGAYLPAKRVAPLRPQFLIFGVSFEAHQQRSLSLEYLQFPGEEDGSYLEPIRRIDHLLQPARHWANFGDLKVDVLAPPGLPVASNLPLQSVGAGHYTAQFDRLPEANLSVFVGPGAGPRWWWERTSRTWLLLAVGALTGLTAGLISMARRLWVRKMGLVFSLLTWGALYRLAPPHLLRSDPTGVMFLWVLFIPAVMVLHILSRSLLCWLLAFGRNRREGRTV